MPRWPIDEKYEMDAETGIIYNRITGVEIPPEEPVMLFRSQDVRFSQLLGAYIHACSDLDHKVRVAEKQAKVLKWQAKNRELVKEPT